MKCGDKEWKHCRVEKMGCKGCHYDKFNNLEIANEFANLTFIYGGKIAFTSEQIKRYQEAVRKIIERNEQLEKYYQCEINLLDSYIPKERVREAIEVINKQIDEAIDCSKGGLDGDFIKKGSELLAQKRILQSLLLVKEEIK